MVLSMLLQSLKMFTLFNGLILEKTRYVLSHLHTQYLSILNAYSDVFIESTSINELALSLMKRAQKYYHAQDSILCDIAAW